MNKPLRMWLGVLPRLKIPYRKFIKKLALVLSCAVFALTASPAFAFYGPEEISSLLSLSQPQDTPEDNKKETPPAPARADMVEVSEIVPEIKIEIKAEEYIPPIVKPVFSAAGGSGAFPFGQCTYYVATRRTVTWSGNAGQWYGNAQAQGYAVGKVAQVGAIMVSYEGISLGHVAYVESVNADGSFVVSEMNYNGNWGKVSSRTVVPGTIYIVGFIY